MPYVRYLKRHPGLPNLSFHFQWRCWKDLRRERMECSQGLFSHSSNGHRFHSRHPLCAGGAPHQQMEPWPAPRVGGAEAFRYLWHDRGWISSFGQRSVRKNAGISSWVPSVDPERVQHDHKRGTRFAIHFLGRDALPHSAPFASLRSALCSTHHSNG